MKIQLAKPEEVSQIKALTEACAAHMIDQGIFQWNEHYPSKAVFENDLSRKELYTLKKGDEIQGVIVLTPIEDEEYKDIVWSGDKGKKLFIHRLAVHPKWQGKGCAQKLMEFAENFAKQEGYSWIRLDTFSQNKRNVRFYEKRGFTRLGSIYFPKQSIHAFYCYDLPL